MIQNLKRNRYYSQFWKLWFKGSHVYRRKNAECNNNNKWQRILWLQKQLVWSNAKKGLHWNNS